MQQPSYLWIHRLLIIALIILLLWKWNCANDACPPLTETVRIDTFIREVHDSSEWTVKPEPINTGVLPDEFIPRKPVEIVPGYANESAIPITDTAEIIRRYLEVKDYSETYPFQNGTIVVENTVGANQLLKQRVLPTFDVMEITKTITQSEKKRGQMYLGVEGMGNRNTPLFGVGGSLMYKTKGDKVYELGAIAVKDNGLMYKAGVKLLLSFRK